MAKKRGIIWLKEYYKPLQQLPIIQCRDALVEWFGQEAENIQYAEMFQICEYGTKPSKEEIKRTINHIQKG